MERFCPKLQFLAFRYFKKLCNWTLKKKKKKPSNKPGIAGWGVGETVLFALSLEIANRVVGRVSVCRKHVS